MQFIAGNYDVIVIGAGHAGVEAALAAARMGQRTLLATLSMDNIALMPCNPSVGGPAKGHLVREVDALGGEMGINADKTCIQFRMLNTGKGPAVHALRAQADKKLYQFTMKETCENTENLDVKQILITDLLLEDVPTQKEVADATSHTSVACGPNKRVKGVVVETGEVYLAPAIVMATGTYLKGRIIIGEHTYSGGPNGQRPAMHFSDSLAAAGVRLMRFKTGTPARVDARTLDYDKMQLQPGDDEARNFSFLSDVTTREQVPCYLTYTNEATHKILRDNMDRAPMANGIIEGVGPRYCPSIETKILRFPDKDRHQLFLEPEGLHTNEVYVQGMSTSMPMDVQLAFLHTIPGLEHCHVMRAGYAIEYDCIDPTQLKPSLEFKAIRGFFSAGQANGTSGYEEAAAQGLIAGINAALFLKGEDPVVLRRSDAYIGVLIDDLVTKGTHEPYRMMTSRAEYRLLLRQDNADMRLTPIGRRIGLVTDERWDRFLTKKAAIDDALKLLHDTLLTPSTAQNAALEEAGIAPIHSATTAYDLLKRTEVTYDSLRTALPDLPALAKEVRDQVEIQSRYEGYIKKQMEQVAHMEKLEAKRLPDTIDYNTVPSLRDEAREKLASIRPESLGQASRISGVSPADVSVLMVWLEQQRRLRESAGKKQEVRV
ncbi:MAG: tRNA uridine-5-carboxymethylaminomethyl(34) synthesis enzyme MnmG [Selenomonas sp.]|uniref:tRNA uridine-5-carboxymethylaminomethyl(34) synthesis enzyme MnmG n=1 Tax=Selenomonas sp. TaxID=2053611 RepID=UPI0025E03458|nr:tRNA uridine-5-carboxymethylaminomethyl(34) synthesis enzyme MnmG [Selenomonas sp.]MCI6232894.1 tRNA uridine-5-carboxymethylaminomethyl(34) synthesis enzyme MnmG [Selenomonas sp.]